MKRDCYIGFYDISTQQSFWGKLIKWVTKSEITHVAPIIKVKTGYITIVLISGGQPKICDIKAFEKLDIKLIDSCYVGAIDTNLAGIFKDCYKYKLPSPLTVILWYFVVRWFTKWYPRTCTGYVCDLFRLPFTDVPTRVIPAVLYRRLKHDCNYVRWQSPSWKNNGC